MKMKTNDILKALLNRGTNIRIENKSLEDTEECLKLTALTKRLLNSPEELTEDEFENLSMDSGLDFLEFEALYKEIDLIN